VENAFLRLFVVPTIMSAIVDNNFISYYFYHIRTKTSLTSEVTLSDCSYVRANLPFGSDIAARPARIYAGAYVRSETRFALAYTRRNDLNYTDSRRACEYIHVRGTYRVCGTNWGELLDFAKRAPDGFALTSRAPMIR